MATCQVSVIILREYVYAKLKVLKGVLTLTEAFMRNGEQNVSLLAQLLMACTCGGAKLDYSPKLTDCLLQIALI